MIRKAEERDISAVVDLSRKFYETTSYAKFADFDVNTVENLVKLCMSSGILLVAELDGVKGFVALITAPFMFNNDVKTAHEVAWYVEPEAQSRGLGAALYRAIEPACRESGCIAYQMVALSSSPPQAAQVYEKSGMDHSETCYTKRL